MGKKVRLGILMAFFLIAVQAVMISSLAFAEEVITLTKEQYEQLKKEIREEVLQEVRKELKEEKAREKGEEKVKVEYEEKEEIFIETEDIEKREVEKASIRKQALEAVTKAIGNLRIGVSASGEVQGTEGADIRISPQNDVVDATMSLDLTIEAPIGKHGHAYTLIEFGLGGGIDGQIPTISGWNDDALGTTISLSELWYEHHFLNMFRLRVGQLDMTTDFDVNAVANDETTQFLSTGFVNSIAIQWPSDNSVGAMAFFSPNDWFQIGFGWADADADYDNIFSDVFLISEINFSPKIFGLRGNYRFNGWFNDTNHVDLRTPLLTSLWGWGFGLSFDQQITHFLTLFARYGYLRERVYQISHAWSAGFEINGSWYGRALDHFGVAYGMGIIGGNWERWQFLRGINTGNEGHLEFYYSIGINKHLSIAPDIQMVFNPNGIDGLPMIWAFGTRAKVNF